MTKKKLKSKPTLDAVDRLSMDLLKPARASAELIGINAFTLKLCQRFGWDFTPNRVRQVGRWLSTEASEWQNPRCGVAFAMLEVK